MVTRILILAVLVIALVSGMAFFVRQQNTGVPNIALTDAQQEAIDRIKADAADGTRGIDALVDDAAEAMQEQEDAGASTAGDTQVQEVVVNDDVTPTTQLPTAATVAGTSTTAATTFGNTFVSTAQATAPIKGSWELVAFDREKWDIDDEDDDVGEIRYKKDVCKQMKDSLRVPVECRKTSKLKRDRAVSLGNDKCAASCSVGSSCVLWNSDEKKDGSLTLNIANYMCS